MTNRGVLRPRRSPTRRSAKRFRPRPSSTKPTSGLWTSTSCSTGTVGDTSSPPPPSRRGASWSNGQEASAGFKRGGGARRLTLDGHHLVQQRSGLRVALVDSGEDARDLAHRRHRSPKAFWLAGVYQADRANATD